MTRPIQNRPNFHFEISIDLECKETGKTATFKIPIDTPLDTADELGAVILQAGAALATEADRHKTEWYPTAFQVQMGKRK